MPKGKILKDKKPPKPKTKKELRKTLDILDDIGQEDEKKGISATKKWMDAFDKKQWEKSQILKAGMDKKAGYSKMGYNNHVSGMLNEEIQDMDIPPGYVGWSEFSKDGVVLRLKTSMGKSYYGAFKPSGTPKYDFQAVVKLLTDMQDQIDFEEYERTKSLGIILPS